MWGSAEDALVRDTGDGWFVRDECERVLLRGHYREAFLWGCWFADLVKDASERQCEEVLVGRLG